MKKIAVIIFTLLTGYGYSQQTQSTEKSKIKLTSINASYGEFYVNNDDYDFDELKGSLKKHQNTIDENRFRSSDINSFFVNQVHLGCGFDVKNTNEQKFISKHELQIGVNYNFGGRREFYFYEDIDESHTIETLDETTTINKFESIGNYCHEDVKELELELAYLFMTNPNKKISFFSGLELGFGYAVDSYVVFSQHSFIEYEINPDSELSEIFEGVNFIGFGDDYYDETINQKNSMFTRSAIPLGINFRLSKKHAFLDQFSLFAKAKFGAEYQITSNTSYLSTYSGFNTGVKYNL